MRICAKPAAIVLCAVISLTAHSAVAAVSPPAPTQADCHAALARARTAIKVLAPGTMSRRFADFDLVQAAAEAGNGEFDDCVDYADNALNEAHHPQHEGASRAAEHPRP